MGAMTGTKPSRSMLRITSGLTPVTSPTSPRSSGAPLFPGAEYFLAPISPPSFPVRPTAFPPNRLMSATIFLLTVPPRTISPTSIASGEVPPTPPAPPPPPAVLDHHRLPGELPDVRQRLDQRLGLLDVSFHPFVPPR